jgi:PAS domain S-box-containing protein
MDDPAKIADLRQRLARAEAALAESEARLAATLDSVPVGVAMLDTAGRIVVSNAQYQRFCPTGTMPSNDPERRWRWRGWDRDRRPLDPTDFPGARASRGESVVPGQELLYTNDDGEDIWVRVATIPLRDAEGRITGQASVVSDIDTLKRTSESLRDAERRQTFLLNLSDTIRLIDDAAGIRDRVTAMVAAWLGVDRCRWTDVNDAGGTALDPEDVAILRAGQAVIASDPGAGHARIVVPVMRRGRLIATLGIETDGTRTWLPADAAVLQDVAERAWVAIDHARTAANFRERDAEFREVQARAQQLIDGIATTIWESPPDGMITTDSPSWRAYTGQSYAEYRGLGWLDVLHPDDRAGTMRIWLEALRRCEPIDLEYRLRGRDGAYRWMNARAIPLRDATGAIQKWLGMNIDIDVRKQLEEAVLDNERRMRALVEGVPQLLWRARLAGDWFWASPQWSAFTGRIGQDSHGTGWLDFVHPDDVAAVTSAWALAQDSGGFDVEHRLRHHDGAYRWFSTRALPIRDDRGRIVEWLGTSNDIDALRQAQDRQEVMVAELQHRTRNIIAIVQSLAEKTIDGANSLEAFEHRFNDRLSALARVQSLLAHATAGQRVTFGDLLDSELTALGAFHRDGVADSLILDGPHDVPLRSGAVQSLALALHELATNAVKYGALKGRGGKLSVLWEVERDDDGILWLNVDWRESGVTLPPVAARTRPGGYGRQLIERALPYQLGAKTSYAFTNDGVHCRIAVAMVSDRVRGEFG